MLTILRNKNSSIKSKEVDTESIKQENLQNTVFSVKAISASLNPALVNAVENTNNVEGLQDIIVGDALLVDILTSLKKHDRLVFQHSIDCGMLALLLSNKGFNDNKELVKSALLHDIGKMNVPLHILLKPTKLNKEEFEKIKRHPKDGHETLKTLVDKRVAQGVLQHHEKWDGSGYPDMLSGLGISNYGRVLSVIDVFDALTSIRPYRLPMRPQDAVFFIENKKKTWFDSEIVSEFLGVLKEYNINK